MSEKTNPSPELSPAHHNWVNALNMAIVEDLIEKGWSVQTDYISLLMTKDLQTRLAVLEEDDLMTTAGIGRLQDNQLAPDVRRDRTFWLNRQHPIDMSYLSMMENLRLCLNQNLFLGLFEYESHYAVYPEGGFYKRHVDALKGSKNRLVSTVCYLNNDWESTYGGQLHLYKEMTDPNPFFSIEPRAQTLAVFLSEDIPHEVKPANQTRRSIAGWFRCNASSADRVDPLR